jgi:hypothetical protein
MEEAVHTATSPSATKTTTGVVEEECGDLLTSRRVWPNDMASSNRARD